MSGDSKVIHHVAITISFSSVYRHHLSVHEMSEDTLCTWLRL